MNAAREVITNLLLVAVACSPGIYMVRTLWRGGIIEGMGREFMQKYRWPLWAVCLVMTATVFVYIVIWPATAVWMMWRRL